MSHQIRAATPADSAAMAALEARAVEHSWNENQYRESILNHQCRVIEAEGELCGLLVFNRVVDQTELLNLVVAPQFQGLGYGKHLLSCLLKADSGLSKTIFLEVRESNHSAIGLYRRFGFTISGKRKDYYPAKNGRENAIIMRYEHA